MSAPIRPIRAALLTYARIGRWGTCAACPHSDDIVYPEFCEETDRHDHWLTGHELADYLKAHRFLDQ